MITHDNAQTQRTYTGLSTDTKPTDAEVPNGSVFVEIDTGKAYFFNADGAAWVEQFSFQA